MAKPKITTKTLDAALHHPDVEAALRRRAGVVLPRIQALAYAAGLPALARGLKVTTGTRPGAQASAGLRRPYARVVAEKTPAIDAEARRARVSPRKIARRAASGKA